MDNLWKIKSANNDFVHGRYEYGTDVMPTITGSLAHMNNPKFPSVDGWQVAWADITVEGTFVVYRKKK
jgi:hypothetical protein